MEAFFNMGGYAVYVWPAYIAAGLILGLLVVISLRQLRVEKNQLERLESQLKATGSRRPRPPASSRSR